MEEASLLYGVLHFFHFLFDQQRTHCFIAGLVAGELVQPAAGNERLDDRVREEKKFCREHKRYPSANRYGQVNCVCD